MELCATIDGIVLPEFRISASMMGVTNLLVGANFPILIPNLYAITECLTGMFEIDVTRELAKIETFLTSFNISITGVMDVSAVLTGFGIEAGAVAAISGFHTSISEFQAGIPDILAEGSQMLRELEFEEEEEEP